jgi:hypothetical protein
VGNGRRVILGFLFFFDINSLQWESDFVSEFLSLLLLQNLWWGRIQNPEGALHCKPISSNTLHSRSTLDKYLKNIGLKGSQHVCLPRCPGFRATGVHLSWFLGHLLWAGSTADNRINLQEGFGELEQIS